MQVLVIDVGGTHVKVGMQGRDEIKLPSGPMLTPRLMIEQVLAATKDWSYDHASIGFPAPMIKGRIIQEPHNLGAGWVGYKFAEHLGKPVRILNDAALQALGSYQGGNMLFLGLGTGLGSALVYEKKVVPLELAHLPYRKGRTYEDYLGVRGLKRLGKKRWNRVLRDIVMRFLAAFQPDYVMLGGGNVKKLTRLPPKSRLGDNRNTILGGVRLWDPDA